MRCHQHSAVEAVAICVSCGRGLCRECHQTTLDERALCGLPQCAGFANRQKAVQFAIRQECASTAARFQMLARVMRLMSGLLGFLVFFSFCVIVWNVFLTPPGATATDFMMLGLACVLGMAARILFQTADRLRALAQTSEDTAQEFEGS